MLDMNEGTKTVDRDHHAMYKRRAEHRNNFKSATDDDDIQSAPSLKSASNPPLPDLYKDKRKVVVKPFGFLESKAASSNFVQKQVRQHDNILLKQRNNLLSSENQKLKTKITVLERQNQRLQKTINNQNSQMKPATHYSNYRQKIKSNDSSIRNIIRGLRKQIQDLKKQNTNIKSAVKFTSLKELEVERDHLAEQTIRLRLSLEQEHNKRVSLKVNVHGVSSLEHKVQFYADKNAQLTKQLRETQEKCKKMEESTSKTQRLADNDRKNSRALQSAMLQIKQLQAEIQSLKGQLKTNHSIPSSTLIQQQPATKENKFDLRRQSLERKPRSVPATKPGVTPKINTLTQCQKCTRVEKQNAALLEKIKKLEGEIDKAGGSLGQLPRGPIAEIKPGELEQLVRFMTLRFKAHRLTYDQSQKYLINCEGLMNEDEMSKNITIRELMESLFVEPFCIISNRYIEVLLAKLVYPNSSFPITIDEQLQLKKGVIVEAYKKMMPVYEIQNQERQEQMFIQVAQLITTYYQQILAALTAKRNGQGTISEEHFLQFFKEIQLEQEYTDFIITQIILESLDMNHLNFFAMFEIFYMPQMNQNQGTGPNKKKKFQVEHEQIVEEEDEEYQESKSHLGSRKKTLEHKEKEEGQQEQYGWEQQKEKNQQKSPNVPMKAEQKEKPLEEQQVYEEEFEDKEVVGEQLPS